MKMNIYVNFLAVARRRSGTTRSISEQKLA